MCEAGVTNAEPCEDNSISAVKVGEDALAERGLDRTQLVHSSSCMNSASTISPPSLYYLDCCPHQRYYPGVHHKV